MKEQILQLRSENLTYLEISKIIGCAKSTVAYYCSPGQKEKCISRVIRRREKNPFLKKLSAFKSRSLYTKQRDFQRIRDSSGKLNMGIEYKFLEEELINKLQQNPVCYLTGSKIDLMEPSTYSFDHIIPVARGGSNDLTNLGLTTLEANQAKGTFMLDDFIILCKQVLQHNGYTVVKDVEN